MKFNIKMFVNEKNGNNNMINTINIGVCLNCGSGKKYKNCW